MLLPILFHPIQSSVAISTSSYTPHPIPFAFYSNKAMPGFCLIRYIYKAHHDDGANVKEGTTLAISKPGGRAYTQQWCPIKFGTGLPMPMNYFTIEKADINLRPVDDMPGKGYAGLSIRKATSSTSKPLSSRIIKTTSTSMRGTLPGRTTYSTTIASMATPTQIYGSRRRSAYSSSKLAGPMRK